MSTNKKATLDIKGDISIHTENILPIIKKWLYSDHEIFLRELVSNAFDAITKLQKIAKKEGLKHIPAEGKINITVDKEKKTITVSDNGVGLDAEEAQKYINQIAFSGAEDFLKKYKEKDEKSQIIGHFGLGFYSSFMVAKKVEIRSLSYKEGATPILWSCDGSTRFEIHEGDRTEIGTDIILHIDEDNQEFLEEGRIRELVKKYANFLPVDIQVNGQTENDKNPLWIKQPSETETKEYEEFYDKLFPFSQKPLFWIHLNVDYPFNLKGILYFPKLQHELDSTKGRVKLFCQQVFVTDNAKEVLPEFLTLLRGAIDCPDIPLNVSRSYLQNDPYVRKISRHIVKKVADKLIDIYKTDKENFQKYWEDIHPFVKYGMMQENDFYDKTKDIIIFKTSAGNYTTIKDYLERNKEKTDKKVVYATDPEAQAAYINLSKDQGIEVIYLHGLIDVHFIQFLESKEPEVKYVAVDAEVSDHLVDSSKTSEIVDADNKTAADKIADIFKKHLKNDKLKLEVKSLKSDKLPAMIVEAEHMKRLKHMTMMMQGAGRMDSLFEDYTLVVNSNNPVIKNIVKLDQSPGKNDLAAELCHYVYDLAQMSQKQLSGEKLQQFLDRSNMLLTKLSNG